MQSRDQKKLSEFEVAQLERLTRRMDDWQRGGLWLWLNGGFLQDRSLWDALTRKRQRTGRGEPFVFHLMF
jgi:hypothetical protein